MNSSGLLTCNGVFFANGKQRRRDAGWQWGIEGEPSHQTTPGETGWFRGGMKLVITRRDLVTGFAALSAGTLTSRAFPMLRNSSSNARIDSGRPPEQYFET